MILAATGPALPLWIVAPPCAILMLILAGYVMALREADVVNNMRISANARQEFRSELRSLEEDVRQAIAEAEAEKATKEDDQPQLRLTDGDEPEARS